MRSKKLAHSFEHNTANYKQNQVKTVNTKQISILTFLHFTTGRSVSNQCTDSIDVRQLIVPQI